MGSMVERVARVIADVDSEFTTLPDEVYLAMARAAIAAMREPTEEMVASGHDWLLFWSPDDQTYTAGTMELWHTMLDAALKPVDTGSE